MRDGWNGLDLGKALDGEVKTINADLPTGMSLTKVTDQAVNISSAVDEFMVKFFVALLVVMLVSVLSMGWRVGIVVAACSAADAGRRLCGDARDRQEFRSHHARGTNPGPGVAGR